MLFKYLIFYTNLYIDSWGASHKKHYCLCFSEYIVYSHFGCRLPSKSINFYSPFVLFMTVQKVMVSFIYAAKKFACYVIYSLSVAFSLDTTRALFCRALAVQVWVWK